MPAHLPVRCCSYRFQDMDRQVDESRSALIGGRWGTSKRMWPTSSRHKAKAYHVCLSPAIGFLFGCDLALAPALPCSPADALADSPPQDRSLLSEDVGVGNLREWSADGRHHRSPSWWRTCLLE